VNLFPKDYKISHSSIVGSSWLEGTTFIIKGSDVQGRLIVWMKDGKGFVHDCVPPKEVNKLQGYKRVEAVPDKQLTDLLRESLRLKSSLW